MLAHSNNRKDQAMAYRSRTYTIRVKYAGQCACCGARIPAGEMADYNPAKREITHKDGIKGKCFSVLNEKANGGFIDIDTVYEDQCAEICGQ
jgi:hypothetical protein